MKKSILALGEVSNGNIITSEVKLAAFTDIDIKVPCKLICKSGKKQKVTVSISENILKALDLSVAEGIWTITFKKHLIATLNFHELSIVIESPQALNSNDAIEEYRYQHNSHNSNNKT